MADITYEVWELTSGLDEYEMYAATNDWPSALNYAAQIEHGEWYIEKVTRERVTNVYGEGDRPAADHVGIFDGPPLDGDRP